MVNKNIKIILNYVVGPGVCAIILYSIYWQIIRQPDWHASLTQLRMAINGDSGLLLAGVVGLMILNWGIEACKWQLVIRRIRPLGWIKAFQAILTGTTLAFFTPNRTGEYVGRVLYLPPGERLSAVSLTLVTSLAQLIITLFIGCLGLLSLRENWLSATPLYSWNTLWFDTFFIGVCGTLLLLTLLYFRFTGLVKWIGKIPQSQRFLQIINVLDDFNSLLLGKLLGLSFLRYLVFILQYYLLFIVFKVVLQPWQVLGTVSVLFLVMAIVPTVALFTELGVRWKASIEIVRLFSNNILGIFATSLTIWLINLVLPALMGSILILKIRLFSNPAARNAPAMPPVYQRHPADSKNDFD